MSDTVPAIDPQRTALLVMDYQTGILGRLPDAEALLARAAEAIGIARDHGARIGYVRVAFTDGDFAAMPPTSRMGTRVGTSPQAFHADSPATAIHDQIAPQPGDVVVRKTRVGRVLDHRSRQSAARPRRRHADPRRHQHERRPALTVRDASDRDYRVVVLADASADPEPDVHDFLIQRIFPRQADVIMLADLSGLLSAGAATGA